MSQTLATVYDARANVPRIALNATVDLNGFYVSPVGGRVFHVRGDGTSILAYDDQYGENSIDMNRRLWPSVASVLPYCVANRGDLILVHQNHTENIGAADAWAFVAGLRIVGLGSGDTRPTFTFTVAASTLLLDVAGLEISNCRFLCAGPAGTTGLTVVAPFTVSGEGCVLAGNFFQVGIDADQICATFMTITGDNVTFAHNLVEGLVVGAEITDVIVLTAADGVTITDNYMKVTVGAAQGLIRSLTTASLRVRIERNFVYNWKASSTVAINFNAALACTGVVADNRMRVTTDGGVAHVTINGANDLSLYNNLGVNNVNEYGIAVGTASS